ncbi:4-hydroxyphenylpyruvate dioxygenase [Sarracenia purpurea var. burkii]
MGKEAEDQSVETVGGFKLVGFATRTDRGGAANPRSDRFQVTRFHHIEFWCTDATNAAHRFSWALGMPIVANSDLSTGNMTHTSYLIRSSELSFLFTTPYSPSIDAAENLTPAATAAIPTFNHSTCHSFAASHGLAVRSIAIEVEDAEIAYSTSVGHGAKPSSPPIVLDN